MPHRLPGATLAACGFVLALALAAGRAEAQAVGPTPYLCFDRTEQSVFQTPFTGSCGSADSPFAALVRASTGYFQLETFEDNSFNVPGVTANLTNVGVTLNDSVDADDGAIDATRLGGHSASTFQVTLTFSAAVLGALPTHVGVVATNRTSGPAVDVTLEAFGPTGTSLGTVVAPTLGGGNDTSDDRFLGWISPDGIGSIRLITSSAGANLRWDHLQYGRPVAALPLDPRAVALGVLLALLVGAPLARWRRAGGRRS